MPAWAMQILEWAVGMALKQLDSKEAKALLADVLTQIDAAVQSSELTYHGAFEGVADEVAAKFHEAVVGIVAALRA